MTVGLGITCGIRRKIVIVCTVQVVVGATGYMTIFRRKITVIVISCADGMFLVDRIIGANIQ